MLTRLTSAETDEKRFASRPTAMFDTALFRSITYLIVKPGKRGPGAPCDRARGPNRGVRRQHVASSIEHFESGLGIPRATGRERLAWTDWEVHKDDGERLGFDLT
jgi:hypothetical protein